MLCELLLLAALLLLPALGEIFSLGPFPLPWLPLLALVPVLIVLVDDLRKAWRRRSSAPEASRSILQ